MPHSASTPSIPVPVERAVGGRLRGAAALRLPLAALVLVVALSGCSAGRSGSDSGSGVSLPAVEQQADGSAAEAGSAAEEAADAAAADGQGVADITQQVVVTGEASVRAPDPVAALADLTATVTSLGGSVASSTTDTDGNSPSAWATVRVPATRYQELLDSLPGLGTVISSSTSTEDVGQQVTDLDARIDALGASVSRLRTLIDEASSTKDLLEAEAQLTSRQAELDSLRAQRAYLADQVSLSTLTVRLLAERVVDDPGASVWQRSWDAFLAALRGIGTGLVWALPWLVLTAVVVAAVALGNRLVARRRARVATPRVPGKGARRARDAAPAGAEGPGPDPVRADAAAPAPGPGGPGPGATTRTGEPAVHDGPAGHEGTTEVDGEGSGER